MHNDCRLNCRLVIASDKNLKSLDPWPHASFSLLSVGDNFVRLLITNHPEECVPFALRVCHIRTSEHMLQWNIYDVYKLHDEPYRAGDHVALSH